MYSFSKRSSDNLATCHHDLQELFNEVIQHYDCTIIEGFRTEARQNELYNAGKSQLMGGASKHNQPVSLAVDVMRYPIRWDDDAYNREFAAFVKGLIVGLDLPIIWGGDWKNFKDYPHWEVV
jgi:peptidoglycan L-alanyl-D-glutamate endopeptidase CwlK